MKNIGKKLFNLLVTVIMGIGIFFSIGHQDNFIDTHGATSLGSEWIRVTSVAGLTSGDKYVFMGGTNSTNVMGITRTSGNVQDRITLSSATNTTNLGSNVIDDQSIGWVLTGSNGVFTISSVKDGTSGYLEYTGSSNAINYGTTAMNWTFTYVSNLFVVTAPNARILQYNSSDPRFATYTSSQVKISLYKYTASIPVSSVTVTPETETIYSGGTANRTVQLSASVEPSNATNKNVTWSSDATSVATVNTSGLVTAVAAEHKQVTKWLKYQPNCQSWFEAFVEKVFWTHPTYFA